MFKLTLLLVLCVGVLAFVSQCEAFVLSSRALSVGGRRALASGASASVRAAHPFALAPSRLSVSLFGSALKAFAASEGPVVPLEYPSVCTSNCSKDIEGFLSGVTSQKNLPVLSLEKFAQKKAVSELMRVDVPARDTSVILQGFVLPQDLSWPFFDVDKQGLAKDKHVLVHRVKGMNSARNREAFRVINELNGSVAIIGSPGIGKSCSMNYFLMEFVRHLGEPGWKKLVLVRYGKTFLKIFRDEASEEIKCEESVVVGLDNLRWVLGEIPLNEKLQMVLLLELDEDEVDPKTGGIPCIVTTSNRDAQTVLKTMRKTGGLHWFLEEPHLEEEAEAVVRLLNAASPSGNKYDWENVVQPRWQVFPRPRQYLSSDPLEKNEVVDEVFQLMGRMSVFDVPRGASDLIAPFYESETTNPSVVERLPGDRPCYRFRLLSLEAALRVGKKIAKDDHLYAVERLGLRWQIEEAYAAYGGLLKGMGDMLDEQFTLKEWEWFEDLGPDKDCLTEKKKSPKTAKTLKVSRKMVEPPITLPQCNSLKSFPGKFFEETVDQMLEDQLYHSNVHNSPLVDFLYKHNDTIYAVQVSSLPCERHKFKMETLESFLDRLGLLGREDRQKKYEFVFLYVMGDNVSKSKGTHVQMDEATSDEKTALQPKTKSADKSENKSVDVSNSAPTDESKTTKPSQKTMSLKAAVEMLTPALKCSSYLVRAKLLPRSFSKQQPNPSDGFDSDNPSNGVDSD